MERPMHTTNMRAIRTILTPLLAPLLAMGGLAATEAKAHAKDAVKLEDYEAKGYFDNSARIGAFYGMLSGERPTAGVAGQAPTESYTRRGFGVDFDVLGFWDATRFDTLLGAEFLAKFGSYGASKVEGQPESGDDKSYVFFRMDAAADYGLLHWDGPVKGRISGGAGFGFDIDGGKWYADHGRAYALLLARVQLSLGGHGLHGSYHWVPTTANDPSIREHRLEGGVGIGPLHAGLRLTVTTVRPSGYTADAPLVSREGGAFVAYAF
jgi:hypothetical protein